MSTLEWDGTEGSECLGYSNWVIYSRLSPFCSEMFQTFSLSCWGGQFLLPQRANTERRDILPTSKLNETVGFECLGHPSWTICSLLSHFWFGKFPTFSPSYWEANSYYPRGPIIGKGNSSNPKVDEIEGFQHLESSLTICFE